MLFFSFGLVSTLVYIVNRHENSRRRGWRHGRKQLLPNRDISVVTIHPFDSSETNMLQTIYMPKAVPPEQIEASLKRLFPEANALRRPTSFEAFSHRVALLCAIQARQAAEQQLHTSLQPEHTQESGGIFGLFSHKKAGNTEVKPAEKGLDQAAYAASLLRETMIRTAIELKRISDGIYDHTYHAVLALEAQLTKAHEEALAEADTEGIPDERIALLALQRTQDSLTAIEQGIRNLRGWSSPLF